MALNKKYVFDLAEAETPKVDLRRVDGMFRHEVVNLLTGNDNVGVELGVAEGIYSKRMVESGKFKAFYGVDLYGDTHDTREYLRALEHVGINESRYKLLRMTFDDALELFDDACFDFVYIDGFAHTGEEGGETLIKWYRKLKVGGMLAGDDYHSDWPLVKWAVNDFALKVGAELSLTGSTEDSRWCKYPTWFITKPGVEGQILLNPKLHRVAMAEKARIHSTRVGARYYYGRLLNGFLNTLGLK